MTPLVQGTGGQPDRVFHRAGRYGDLLEAEKPIAGPFDLDGQDLPNENTLIGARTVNPFNGVAQSVYILFTPRHAASAAIDYEYPMTNGSVRAHFDGSYASAQYAFPDLPVKSDESFLVNGRLSLADLDVGAGGNAVSLSIWGRNLLNNAFVYRRSAENRATYGDYGNFNAPRTFGAEISFKY